MNLKKIQQGNIVLYVDADKAKTITKENAGAWVLSINNKNADDMIKICKQAVTLGVAPIISHTTCEIIELQGAGVCRFCCSRDDTDSHKKILSYLLKTGLINLKSHFLFIHDVPIEKTALRFGYKNTISLQDFF